MWDEITYPFTNLNDATAEIWGGTDNSISESICVCEYLSMLELDLYKISRRAPDVHVKIADNMSSVFVQFLCIYLWA